MVDERASGGPGVNILSAGAAQGLASAVAAQAGIELSGTFGAVGGVIERFLAGDACDVVILTHAQVTQLTARNRVALDFCADLGVVRAAMRALSEAGGHPIGCAQTTEIVATPGVALVAPLPREHQLATVYTVALKAGTASAHARDFAQRLTGADTVAARSAAGFEGVAIRRATGADAAGTREVVFGALAEYGLVPEPFGTDADLMDLDAHYFSRGGMFDVAIDGNGRIVACCGLKPMAGGALELRKMYAQRDFRGKGLGRRLLERSLAFARATGSARVELETASVLKEAIALYESASFVPRPGKLDTCRCDRAFVLALS
ncbi:MAG: GNAT family N-acetyltransferase [Betaproteobacteria bacterium]|nr:GNAT family N-acetyltransferase [Betaproteobacteria bacterium]